VGALEESFAPRTRFDLSFRLGDVPVRVHPFFWLSAVLLGLYGPGEGADKLIHLLIWVGIVFVSVLVHEMGHILMGRYFGSDGHILLTGFCGLAVGSSEVPERWQRNLVLLAGPGAGFLFGAAVFGLFWAAYPDMALFVLGSLVGVGVEFGPDVVIPSAYLWITVFSLLWINLAWGLVNLLPIWPLDGGQICRETCQYFESRDAIRLSLKISIGTAIAFALLGLIEFVRKEPLIPHVSLGDSLFPVLFFGILAFSSYRLLQFVTMAGSDWEEMDTGPRQPWEQDADWWKRGGSPWRD
jgi:stage IV sporulation protein FB